MDTSGELNYCIKLICKVRIDEGSASPYSSLAKSTVDRKDMETPGGCKRHRLLKPDSFVVAYDDFWFQGFPWRSYTFTGRRSPGHNKRPS
eukprot:5989822-Pyramimonas_sp.AAC.1